MAAHAADDAKEMGLAITIFQLAIALGGFIRRTKANQSLTSAKFWLAGRPTAPSVICERFGIKRKIISLHPVVESVRDGGGGWELCATAKARFDAARSIVVVELDSVVQPMNLAPGADGCEGWFLAKPKI